MQKIQQTRSTNGPRLIFKGGRIWFSKERERRLLFILTLILLGTGILIKVGLI